MLSTSDTPPSESSQPETISISQQSLYYFMIAVVFAVAGFIVGGITFSARGVSTEDIRSAAAAGAREAVRSELASLQLNTGGAAAPQPTAAPVTVDTSAAPSWGPADAKVTLVEFSDFECPYCGRFNRDTYDLIRQQYGDSIRYVFKHLPLTQIHPNAERASMAAECANEQGKFWEYHSILFQNQTNLSAEALVGYAQTVGVADQAKFNECLQTEKYLSKVQADMNEGFNLGIGGTPTFFINGIALVGAQPFSVFRNAIDNALNTN